ncbi:MAG: hypothetical protein NC313_14495 [Butyrivibrio sp.]|nr:hypothetical protein [Butyrivibrio sp.]MCM1263917.1 hypothetical protein [Butyrivibrio sp.]
MKNGKNLTNQQKKNRALGKDNRGSAIILVIIAIALISILASTIMWASYVNYMIKFADIRNKNSFYSSETVVEQIMAGMQHEASAAISRSYQEVMQNWDNDGDEGSRFARFTTSYLDALVGSLKSPTDSSCYNRDVLKSYIDEDLFNNGVDLTEWDNYAYPPKMEIVNNSSLILHNIRVSYTDENGYVSIVNTDICIDVPKLVFYQNGNIDDLYDYALIANNGIVSTLGSSTIDGSLYAGDSDGTGGINVRTATSLTVNNGRYVISKGDIKVDGPTAGFIVHGSTNADNEVYAAGLDITSGTLSLDGKTYVANDLILAGTGSTATLKGEYYGFGWHTDTGLVEGDSVAADKSSAILINGKSATVDMSSITKLMLAGRAYIGQHRTTGSELMDESKDNPPILMGESIAVKGDQVAYLVPAECIGILDGKSVIGRNPLDTELYAQLIKYENGDFGDSEEHTFQKFAFDKPIYKLGNKKLSDFGVSSSDNIREVHAQYNSTEDKNKQLVYYYLVMDEENAAEYFQAYYNFNTNKEALDKYFDKYATGGIILGEYGAENTKYTILGNSVVSDVLGNPTLYAMEIPEEEGEGADEGVPAIGYPDIEINDDNSKEVDNTWDKTQTMDRAAEIELDYTSLCRDLTKANDGGVPGENQNVFDSIIRWDEVDKIFNDPDYVSLISDGVFEVTTADGYKAVITNRNDYTPTDSKIRLIVATDKNYNPLAPNSAVTGGNVTITSNFTGLIIAQGKVTIANNVVINRDKSNVYKVLNTPLKEGSPNTVMGFFQNGDGMLSEEVTETSKVDASGTLDINLSQIVRYSNWIKK